MATRPLCSTLFAALIAALIALGGCTDKSSYFSQPTDPDGISGGGGGQLDSPTPQIKDNSPRGGNGPDADGSDERPTAGTDTGPDAPEPVPEPGTILLFGVGLTGLAFYRRRRRPEASAPSI